ncbi:DUF6529 family protein [Streptomyces chartreusis]|uniref:DUF6529 family protein n=1 Tax=Streptomyces chartreusis TaxID=1969 RepID=UPI0038227E0B
MRLTPLARPLRLPAALGRRPSDSRVFIHCIPGCFAFAVFGAKMLLIRSERLPGRPLPSGFFRTFGVTT